MEQLLKNKKVIFLDVGYTIDAPASGDWMFTDLFLEYVDKRLKMCNGIDIVRAREEGLLFLRQNHHVKAIEEECIQFSEYYSIISSILDLKLSQEQQQQIAWDRAFNMSNYLPYTGLKDTLNILSNSYKLGIISDTWPSIEIRLKYYGVSNCISFRTYSCFVGALKPDKRLFLDALAQCNVSAGQTVFVDDDPDNLNGAATFGIVPILITTNPTVNHNVAFCKIQTLKELLP